MPAPKEITELIVANGGDSNITDDIVGATSLHYGVLGWSRLLKLVHLKS